MRFAPLLPVLAVLAACEPSNTSKGDPVTPGTTSEVPSSTAPTSSAPLKSEGTKTIFVREALADCEGEGPMKCLQIRESENDDWTLVYGGIDGFQYEESYAYLLRVKSEAGKGPKADSPSKKLRLVEVLSKQKPGAPKK